MAPVAVGVRLAGNAFEAQEAQEAQIGAHFAGLVRDITTWRR